MKSTYLTWIAAATLLAACDSPLDVNPADAIEAGSALTSARAVERAVTGAYSSLQTAALYSQELNVFPDLYADNLAFTGTYTSHGEVAQRNILPSNTAFRDAWFDSYSGINRANNVVAALETVEMADAARDRARGEALFIRALHYFDLVRYFGGVPLVTEPTTSVTPESQAPRASVADVYARIEADLTEAASLLSPSRSTGRATRGAANALLARVHLEQGEWAQARDRATLVINSGSYSLAPTYAEVFTNKNSSEAIFELQYSTIDSNSQAYWLFPQSLGGRRGYAPTQAFFDSYEAGDTRRDAAIGRAGSTLYGKRYFRISGSDDNVTVLRLADMYLVRAEANARLGADPATVRADIDVVRRRAGLADLPATVTGVEALIDAVLRERRVEFFLEGHRFFDLRRTGRAQSVLNIQPFQLLFPIPQQEIDVNSNLQQNPGY